MGSPSKSILRITTMVCLISAALIGCKASGNDSPNAAQPPFMSTAASAPPQVADEAPPPEKIGGFDGKRPFAPAPNQVPSGPPLPAPQPPAQLRGYLKPK